MAGVRAIVIHDHTPGERTPVTGFRRFAKAIINRIPWISADLLIGATRYVTMRHLAVNAFPAERCYTAENGIPAASSREASDLHEEFEIPRNRFIMISVGRAHRVKGISLVLAAMRELVHDRGRSDLHYVHVGDGPDLEHFKAMTDLYNIGRFVTFAGRRNDVAKIARGADLAIHASDAEVGYSLSVLECMQAGLPVIVSDAPSVSGATVPGETGLVFERGNSSSAARSIEFLLDNQACAKSLGVAAQSAAEKRFNLDQTHASVLEAIDRCAFSSLR
jgi:glycosyltransferase involved in cell wall biosynthesis